MKSQKYLLITGKNPVSAKSAKRIGGVGWRGMKEYGRSTGRKLKKEKHGLTV